MPYFPATSIVAINLLPPPTPCEVMLLVKSFSISVLRSKGFVLFVAPGSYKFTPHNFLLFKTTQV